MKLKTEKLEVLMTTNKTYTPILIDSVLAAADLQQKRFVGFDGFGAAGFVEMAQCHTEGIGRVEMWVDVFFWNVENAA